MTIIEILGGSDLDIKNNIKILEDDYKEKFNREVCRTCPSSVQFMLLSLKNYYKMVEFKFKKESAQYKNKKGDNKTISNSTMTNARAIEFLKTNPERISLFITYPSNWEELIEGKQETDEEREVRLACESEKAAKEKADLEAKEKEDQAAKEKADLEAKEKKAPKKTTSKKSKSKAKSKSSKSKSSKKKTPIVKKVEKEEASSFDSDFEAMAAAEAAAAAEAETKANNQ